MRADQPQSRSVRRRGAADAVGLSGVKRPAGNPGDAALNEAGRAEGIGTRAPKRDLTAARTGGKAEPNAVRTGDPTDVAGRVRLRKFERSRWADTKSGGRATGIGTGTASVAATAFGPGRFGRASADPDWAA